MRIKCPWTARTRQIAVFITVLAAFPILTKSTISSADLNAGIVAFYSFDGNADDLGPEGIHATVNGALPAPDRYGVENRAYSMHMDGQYVSASSAIFAVAQNLTVMAWVENTELPYPVSGDNHILAKGPHEESARCDYSLSLNTDGRFEFKVVNAEGAAFSVFSSPADGGPGEEGSGEKGYWEEGGTESDGFRHVAGVYDHGNGSMKIYVDGVRQGEPLAVSGEIMNSSSRLFIGSRDSFSENLGWKGTIDEIRLYGRALADNEILEAYHENRRYLIAVIDSDKIDEDLVDFPVLLQISSASGTNRFDASAFLREVCNRRFSVVTESGEQCYAEIEVFAGEVEQQVFMWVKVPTVFSNEDTVLKIYYGSGLPENTGYVGGIGEPAGQSVWDSNFVGVWHMSLYWLSWDSWVVTNSVPAGPPATVHGSLPSETQGIGNDLFLNGTDNYLSLGNPPWPHETGTVEAVVEPWSSEYSEEGEGSGEGGGEEPGNTAPSQIFSMGDGSASGNAIRFYLDEDSLFLDIETSESLACASNPIQTGIRGVAAVQDGEVARVFIDGAPQANAAETGSWFSDIAGADNWRIGNAAIGGTDIDFFKGAVAEVRISSVPRSDAWLKATHCSNVDRLIAYGGIVDDTPPDPVEDLTVDGLIDCASALLNWEGYDETDQDVSSYKIYAETNAFESVWNLTPKAEIGSGRFEYTLGNLGCAETYYFAVVPSDRWGNFDEEVANLVQAVIYDPAVEDVANLRFERQNDVPVFLWDHSASENLDHYEATLNGGPVEIIPKSRSSYEIIGLDPYSIIEFSIAAASVTGQKSKGASITANCPMENPEGLSAVPIHGGLSLSWNATNPPEEIAEYRVYLSRDPFTSVMGMTPVQTVADTSATVYVAENEAVWFVAVTAVDHSGQECKSVGTISETTLPATYVSGEITGNTTWTLSGSPYHAIGDVIVRSSYSQSYTSENPQTAVLTVEPGVTIRFDKGTGLYIGKRSGSYGGYFGSLKALGTEESPITFTSTIQNPSDTERWTGICFHDAANDDPGTGNAAIMENCIVENAGVPTVLDDTLKLEANIFIYQSNPVIRRNTIRASANHGIFVAGSAEPVIGGDEGSGNTITGNGGYGIYSEGNSALPIIGDNTIANNGSYAARVGPCNHMKGNACSGNAIDGIEIFEGEILDDTTWWKNEAPYHVTGNVTVHSSGYGYCHSVSAPFDTPVLSIEPGATIRFKEGAGLYIGKDTYGYYCYSGSLQAQGADGLPITFSSIADEPSDTERWTGIYFNDAANDHLSTGQASIMEHCIVENGGLPSTYGSQTLGANIFVSNSKPIIQKNIIRNSGNAGIYITGSGSDGMEISCNDFKDNLDAVRIAGGSRPLIENNNFLGNSRYGVVNESSETINATSNWWNDAEGPDGGSGDVVHGAADYSNWLTEKTSCVYDPPLNFPPREPSNPSPCDGERRVPVVVDQVPVDLRLSWNGGDPNLLDGVTYDLSWGLSMDALEFTLQGLESPECSLSNLQPGVTYYWQVKAIDTRLAETVGPVWSFATLQEPCDLAVTDVSFAPSSGIKVGDPVTITATVENIGVGSTVYWIDVELEIDQMHSFFSASMPPMNPGETIQVQWQWTAEPGDHEFSVEANDAYGGEISLYETNYENNRLEGFLPCVSNDPPPPVDLTADCSGDGASAVLDWSGYGESGTADIDYYEIYMEEFAFSDAGELEVRATVPAEQFSYVFEELETGGTYHFAVVAVDLWDDRSAVEESVPCSPEDILPPEDVENLHVASVAEDSIEIAWNPAQDFNGVAGYRVHIGESVVEIGDPEQTSCRVNSLSPGTEHAFRVTAYDEYGNENEGTSISEITLFQNPEILAAEPFNGMVRLTWEGANDPENNLKHYTVYYKKGESGFASTEEPGVVPFINTSGVSAEVSGLTNGAAHWFAVTATNVNNRENTTVPFAVSATPCEDPEGPVISNVRVNGNPCDPETYIFLLKNGVVSLDATDNAGVNRVEFFLDDQPAHVDPSGDGESDYSWELDIQAAGPGPHLVRIMAYDENENFSQTAIPLTIDYPPPQPCFQACIDGG